MNPAPSALEGFFYHERQCWMNIEFVEYEMDQSIIAPVIYGAMPHRTTNKGVRLSASIVQELEHFFSLYPCPTIIEKCYAQRQGLPTYFRGDAYFDGERLWILEVNGAFVDGWGTALNLARSCGISVDSSKLVFPQTFACTSPVYAPEMNLWLREMAKLGKPLGTIVRAQPQPSHYLEPTYVYGRGGMGDPNLFPYCGSLLDQKRFLYYMERQWKGDLVKIPKHYRSPGTSWDELPRDVVLKFDDKSSEECQRARASVLMGKPKGKAPFLKRSFQSRQLIGQERIEPTKIDGKSCQLIIMVIGSTPVTGYVQYSHRQIINDDSVHGPLELMCS
ncbi:MAG: hypothetical protein UZ21_OP11001000352 [Microgenomates bacterium OLB22]|nr:MAG: hypothetical protein UZ21_OP11001000352 [Microgenomates bacterium OLB22]